ncbi:hypothetical protein BG011_003521 [Mortierella polycephala]|uniref:PH domain-containing protein n=1 Tax=Mortierella polycephala TaxID=41804 RepID=A0A9P6Q231_9FUNG|nr:hypothetical protein BG011_003521 [Mortierella polycephala]
MALSAKGHASWVQPKSSSPASTSLSTIQSTFPANSTTASSSGSAYAATSTLLGKKSQQPLQTQSLQRKMSQDESPSYYAALNRPISPTVIMNYIPPPTSTAPKGASQDPIGHTLLPHINADSTIPNGTATVSSVSPSTLRPHSATAALSSSFNALGTVMQPSLKPSLHQGPRSSYIAPSNASTTTNTAAGIASNGANLTPQQTRIQQGSFSPAINAEDPASNSSRFPRRGALFANHDNDNSLGDGQGNTVNNDVGSRRQSVAFSDADSPAQNQYRQHLQQQQQFSPASQRTDTMGSTSPGTAGVGMQLQIAKEGWLWRRGNLLTWKRCYAIGRYRGDAHPGILTLFKDNEHLFPIKTIDMSECYEVQVKAQDVKGTGRFEFKLVTRKEETWFATDTMSERTGWIDALNSLMAKVVGASLMKLEQKLNTIRHRNNSLGYAHTTLSTEKSTLEGHLHQVQQDLASREQQLSQREQELERKRIESLLVQLETWRAAAKVTVNQHYTVRDQLLERVMKTARTYQELQERAKVHLETGSDQAVEVVNSHLDCLKVHASETALNPASYKILKSIMVGLTVNLDTRSSEIKRVLLVMDQYISAAKSSTRSTSTPTSPRLNHEGARDRRISVAGPVQSTAKPLSVGYSVYLLQVKEKYTETLEILEGHSRSLKRILERADINNSESAQRFHDEAKDTLNGLLHLPTYEFSPCIPDQPLPGAADTFYREDLVLIHQKSQELLRNGQGLSRHSSLQQVLAQEIAQESQSKESEVTDEEANKVRLRTPSPIDEHSTVKQPRSLKQLAPSVSSSISASPPKLSLALPSSLSSFLFPDTSTATSTITTNAGSTVELTQRLRDTILPEFDHISIKQEESLQSMTTLLNKISTLVVNKLTEIKDATAGQRQEFEELKDEIIDVMQLSATDPSAHQRDISALSEIRSKLAEITSQLAKVQSAQQQGVHHGFGMPYGALGNNGSYRRLGGPSYHQGGGTGGSGSTATATGYSLLQRSASTMVHSSTGGANSSYHAIDSGPRQHLQRVNSASLQNRIQIPASTSLSAGLGVSGGLSSLANGNGPSSSSIEPAGGGGTKQSRIAGMARMFEEGESLSDQHSNSQQTAFGSGAPAFMHDFDHGSNPVLQQHVVSKLDQLMLLLEFVNTAQCRMMAYQDLEFERSREGNDGVHNVDDGRMMAVQEHMEQMDRKMNLQMHLLRRLVTLQGSSSGSTPGLARVQEIADDKTQDSENDQERPTSDALEDMEAMAKTLPSENDLTLVEVLSRLDLQVIPSVNTQSDRIQELSEQLSEMKSQLDEQQRRQEAYQQQFQYNSNASKPRISTSPNIARSNSVERPTTPLLRSRSPSQILVHQQQQAPVNNSTASSPFEVESPASWRASLRSSVSNSSSASRERNHSSSLQDGLHTSVSNSSGLLTKTSDRIAEMLDRMDARMGEVIDEQLAKYEKGNKELLAKVFELLDNDDDEEKDVGQEARNKKRAAISSSSSLHSNLAAASVVSKSDIASLEHKLQGLEQILGEQNGQGESRQAGNQALWKEMMTSLKELRGLRTFSTEAHQQQWTKDVNETLERILKGQKELLSNGGNHSQNLQSQADAYAVNEPSWTESFEKLKTLIQQESDRSEDSLNEQHDELLEKMNLVLSAIQESSAQTGTRDADVKEELQEMREWIVRHSSMQTANLRDIVLAATTTSTTASGVESTDAVVVERAGADGNSHDGDEEEYTEVDIFEDLGHEQERRMSYQGSLLHAPTSIAPLSPAASASASEIQELKELLETFTKIQMATFSELADNVSGVEKMMRDISRTMGVRRGGTIQRKKEAEQDRAILAMEVKETVEEVMSRMNSSSTSLSASSQPGAGAPSRQQTTITTSRSSAEEKRESGIFKYLYQPRRPKSNFSTSPILQQQTQTQTQLHSPTLISPTVSTVSMEEELETGSRQRREHDHAHAYQSMKIQMDQCQDQIEQLYRRKVRVEIEVEDLQSEKSELRKQVEQLRKEKQELLLLPTKEQQHSQHDGLVEVSATSTSGMVLEKVLQDRVAMLLQETARLEALKSRLEKETGAH